MHYLLEKGASLSGNNEKISLFGISICVSSPEIFKFLIEKLKPADMLWHHGADKVYLPEAVIAHYRNSTETARRFLDILLENNWDIRSVSPSGKSIMEYALAYSDVHIDVVRYLLDKGASPRDKKGGVYAHAVNKAISKLLLERAQKKSPRP